MSHSVTHNSIKLIMSSNGQTISATYRAFGMEIKSDDFSSEFVNEISVINFVNYLKKNPKTFRWLFIAKTKEDVIGAMNNILKNWIDILTNGWLVLENKN